jgi:pSer/pThr/pTyr-binding forkhead associated (FHA) protein
MSSGSASARLRIRTGPLAGRVFELRQALRLGRHPFNELSLPDPGASRYHCWLVVRDGVPTLEDLASANGTLVNGERLRARRALHAGDIVRIGQTEILIEPAA